MLNCKMCDYYQPLAGTAASRSHSAKCEFSGVSFLGDVENLEMEYPCSRIHFSDYLRKKQDPQAECNVHKLMNDDWRYIYLKGHVKKAAVRAARSA